MPANETPFGAGWSEHRFLSFDKTVLFYRHRRSVGPCRARVLVLHGNGEHGGRYRELAEFLAQKGFECWVPDLRGYGQSGGKRGCLKHFSDYYRDLEALNAVVRRSGESRPFFLLGHSYGGLVLSSWLAASPDISCRGLILSSPNIGISIPVPGWLHISAIVGSYILPDLTQPNHVDSSKLTHDKAIFQSSQTDPLINQRLSLGLYRELTSQIAHADRIASKILCPALVLQAGEDHVVSRQATVRFFEQLRSQDKEIEIYENLYHEILNETQRGAIFARIAGWIDKHL